MARPRKIPVSDPKKAVGYIRVSTEDQALGPEAQLAALQRWADQHGVDLVSVHEDRGISGAAPLEQRPGLLLAIDALRDTSAGVFLVAKQDRLARDMVLAAMIERLVERNGSRVLSADGVGAGEGPEAALMRAMVRAFAEYERALIRARTSAALQAKKARGERAGQIPIGFELEGEKRLRPQEDEQRAILIAKDLRNEHGWSYQQIADQLAVLGFKPRGAKWHPMTIARMVA